MTTPILLPPLPEPDDYGYYAGNDQGPPWVRQLAYSADQLRARDLEVAQAVLEGAEQVADACTAARIRNIEVKHE
jgi:hypothetical protein